MTDDQFKQLIAAIEALREQTAETDCSTNVSFIDTEVAKIQKDIAAIKQLLEQR